MIKLFTGNGGKNEMNGAILKDGQLVRAETTHSISEEVFDKANRALARGDIKKNLRGDLVVLFSDNTPVPRGGKFWEEQYAVCADGVLRQKIIKVDSFQGRSADWREFASNHPYVDGYKAVCR